MKEPKKANNARNFFSNLIFVLLSILGGLVMGFAFGIVCSFVYLVIVFPILIGFLGGYIITENAKYMKTRNVSLIISTSVLTAVVLFAAIFYTRFMGVQVITSLKTFGGLSDKNLMAAKVLVNYALEKDTGYPGFVGYVLFKAKQGVSIGRVFRSDSLNLGPVFTWLYWLAELGAITYITIFKGKEIASKQFCEFCNSWYAGKKHIGGVPAAKAAEIVNLIKQNDYVGVGKALEENPEMPSAEFYLQSCTSCDKNISFLSVTKVSRRNGKLIFTDILNTSLKPRESKLLVQEIRFH